MLVMLARLDLPGRDRQVPDEGQGGGAHPYLWGARAMFVLVLLVMCLLIRKAWNKKKTEIPAAPAA